MPAPLVFDDAVIQLGNALRLQLQLLSAVTVSVPVVPAAAKLLIVGLMLHAVHIEAAWFRLSDLVGPEPDNVAVALRAVPMLAATV